MQKSMYYCCQFKVHTRTLLWLNHIVSVNTNIDHTYNDTVTRALSTVRIHWRWFKNNDNDSWYTHKKKICLKKYAKNKLSCVVILITRGMVHQICDTLNYFLNVLKLLKAANSSDDMSPSPKPNGSSWGGWGDFRAASEEKEVSNWGTGSKGSSSLGFGDRGGGGGGGGRDGACLSFGDFLGKCVSCSWWPWLSLLLSSSLRIPESFDFVVITVWGETEARLWEGLLLLLLRLLLIPGAVKLSLLNFSSVSLVSSIPPEVVEWFGGIVGVE